MKIHGRPILVVLILASLLTSHASLACADPPVTPYRRGLLHLAAGDLRSAHAEFTKAIKARPRNALALYERGTIEATWGKHAAALADYDRAIAANPRYVLPHLGRGDVQLTQGRPRHALFSFHKALKLAQGVKNDGLTALAHLGRGWARLALATEEGANDKERTARELALAAEEFDQALALNARMTTAYVGRGRVAALRGAHARARKYFDKAIALDKRNSLAWDSRGWLNHTTGNLDAAIDDMKEAVRLVPNSANYRDGLVRALMARALGSFDDDKLEDAIKDYDAVISVQATSTAHRNRGECRRKQGKLLDAAKDFEESLRMAPQQTLAKDLRRFIETQLGRPARY